MNITRNWAFPAQLVRVVDGDTVEVLLDLGFKTTRRITVRVAHIDAPEAHTETREAGEAASLFAEDWLKNTSEAEWPLEVVTYKDRRSFNRYVAEVRHMGRGGESLADALLKAGHAVPREV